MLLAKINQRIQFLAQTARFLDKKTILAGSLVQPYFDYSCGSGYTGLIKQLKHKHQIS